MEQEGNRPVSDREASHVSSVDRQRKLLSIVRQWACWPPHRPKPQFLGNRRAKTRRHSRGKSDCPLQNLLHHSSSG